jgi:hypothetical protein
MKIVVKSYDDFKAASAAFGSPVAALYWDGAQASPPETAFQLSAFVAGGSVVIKYDSHPAETALPPAFLTDFPAAVRLMGKFTIGC